MNSSESLDLYAKVEDLLGVYEAAPRLYAHYLLTLQDIEWRNLLDVGCGSGEFLASMQGAFPGHSMRGIDLSPEMVRRARSRGVEAECVDLCETEGSFDAITCVFDMLNYLSSTELPGFLACLKDRLKPGGVLLADLNTPYGFEEVAVGAFTAEDEDRFLAIESDYEEGIYTADFTLFERSGKCWHKSSQRIRQYYHAPETIVRIAGLELIGQTPVSLYGDEADKVFLVYRKA